MVLRLDAGEAIAAAEYRIHFEGGAILAGTLDSQGKARHDNIDRRQVKKVEYKPRQPDSDKPASPLDRLLG